MKALKDKVTGKFSRVRIDPPSNSANDAPVLGYLSEDPVIGDQEEGFQTKGQSYIKCYVRPLPKEETYGSEKSLSSYLYSFLPSVNLASYIPNKRWHEVRPFRSLSNKWRSKSHSSSKQSDCNVDHISECESTETLGKSKEDEIESLQRNICESLKKTSTSHDSVPYISGVLDQSSFLTSDLYDFLQSSLPNIVKGCQWVLLYSTTRDGISLKTLLRKGAGITGYCLLIVGDMQGAVFGGLLQCPLNPTSKPKYQGTNQSFVFTTIYDQPRLFRATGANRYYYLCQNNLLAFGGGGNFALCLDEDLLRGSSGACDTFGNLCLARSPEFELKNVELWGFTHSLQYIT